jgi:hypothetical protein
MTVGYPRSGRVNQHRSVAASGHPDHLAGDVAGLLGSQEDERRGEFGRAAGWVVDD